jgi:hypothetical protein
VKNKETVEIIESVESNKHTIKEADAAPATAGGFFS